MALGCMDEDEEKAVQKFKKNFSFCFKGNRQLHDHLQRENAKAVLDTREDNLRKVLASGIWGKNIKYVSLSCKELRRRKLKELYQRKPSPPFNKFVN
jgi:hypothetical protein